VLSCTSSQVGGIIEGWGEGEAAALAIVGHSRVGGGDGTTVRSVKLAVLALT